MFSTSLVCHRCGHPAAPPPPAGESRCRVCETFLSDAEHGNEVPPGWAADAVGDCHFSAQGLRMDVEISDYGWFFYYKGSQHSAGLPVDAWPRARRWNALQAAMKWALTAQEGGPPGPAAA